MRNAHHHHAAVERLAADVRAAVLLAGFVVFSSGEALAGGASAQFQIGITIVPAGAKPAVAPDPLAGTVWRSLDGPWPGTLSFGKSGRIAHVAMTGATPEDVSYSLVLPSAGAAAKDERGELRIIPMNGPTAAFFFTFSAGGRTMTLIAARTGARGHYLRVQP